MNDKTMRNFCRRVGRKLVCLPKTREILLRGLMEELSELSDRDFEERIGSVEAVAAELQDSIPEEEYREVVAAQKHRMLIAVLFAVALAMAVVCITLSKYLNVMHYFYPAR